MSAASYFYFLTCLRSFIISSFGFSCASGEPSGLRLAAPQPREEVTSAASPETQELNDL